MLCFTVKLSNEGYGFGFQILHAYSKLNCRLLVLFDLILPKEPTIWNQTVLTKVPSNF